MPDLISYLNFDGQTKAAMEFYAKCLGGELFTMPFSEAPGDHPPAAKDRIMHATVSKGGKPLLMASDTMPGMEFRPGNNFCVSAHCATIEEIESLFAAFSDGATIKMPLQDVFWGARFGMLTDKFGVNWMFNHPLAKQG